MSMLPPTSSTTSNYSPLSDVPKQENPPPSDSHLVQQGQYILGACCQQRFQALGALPTSSSVTLKQKREREIIEDSEESYSSLRTIDVQDPNSEENKRCRMAAGMAKTSSALSDPVNFFAQFPAELVYAMFSKLDPDSLLNMLMVDSRFHNLIKTCPILYKEFLVGQAVKKMLKCAAQIEDGKDKNQALCSISLLQSSTNPRKALEIANHLPDESTVQPFECDVHLNKLGVICTIIEEQASTNLEQALSFTEDIVDKSIKDWALYKIINAQAAIKLEKMLPIAEGIQDTKIKDKAFYEIACKQASANPKEALRFLMEKDLHDLDDLLEIIFKNMLQNDPEEAFLTAYEIQNETMKDDSLYAIARIQASTSLENAHLVAKDIQDEETKDWALEDIVRAQASLDPEKAYLIAKDIQNEYRRNEAIVDIVQVFASTDLEKAFTIAKDVQGSDRDAAFRKIYKVLASTDLEKAREMAALEDESVRDIALAEIVAVQVSLDIDQALAIARIISDKYLKNKAFRKIIKEQALISLPQALCTIDEAISTPNCDGHPDFFVPLINKAIARTDPKRAIEIAQVIQNQELREKMLVEVVEEQASIDLNQALAAADLIRIYRYRDKVCCTIASRFVDHKAALAFAGNIQNPNMKARFLFVISKELTDPQQSQEVLIQALNAASTIPNPAPQIRLLHDIVQELIKRM